MVAAAADRARRARRTSSWCCSTTSATRSSAATARTSPTPTFDRLAGRRAALQQLPHHRAVLADAGLPADRAQPPRAAGWRASSSSPPASPATTRRCRRPTASCPRSSSAHGYATFAVGKWHLAPAPEMAMGAPRERWPLGRGFERFYGFLGRRDRPVPPRPRARQPPDRPAAHAGGGLPPHRGPRRPRDRLPRRPAAPSRRPAVLPLLRARRVPRARTRCRGRTASATAGASTRAGTRGARRSSPASRRAGCCRRAPQLSERPHVDRRVGLARRRRAPPVRPDDGGLRRLPRAHRRPGRPGRSTSSTASASSTTRSC